MIVFLCHLIVSSSCTENCPKIAKKIVILPYICLNAYVHYAIINLLEDLRLFETWKPDVVLYDVLGDVVCGGFAAPIREGYAEKVLIVTSGEKMALYAANNINTAVANFEDRGYARVAGIVLNHRNVPDEESKVQAFAKEHGLPIVAQIPRSDDINRFEDEGKTVIEGDSTLSVSQRFLDLAASLTNGEV